MAMDSSEKLRLQWNDFKENITSSFKELREDKEFSDVTLACQDGQQIEAHKIVLVSSSPFFMELLKKHKHPHPLVYMGGLKSEDLLAVVDFLYFGEAKVDQENLDSFLLLAEELRLKGLSGGVGAGNESLKEISETKGTHLEQEVGQQVRAPLPKPNFEERSPQGYFDTTASVTNDKISVDLQDLDEQIRSMITRTDLSAGAGKGKLASCNVCGKEGPTMAMSRHVEAHHITGVSHACDLCGKISRSRNGLNTHKITNHVKMKMLQD